MNFSEQLKITWLATFLAMPCANRIIYIGTIIIMIMDEMDSVWLETNAQNCILCSSSCKATTYVYAPSIPTFNLVIEIVVLV